jgi:hypothetical protein
MSDEDDTEKEEKPSEDDDDLPPLGGDREMKSFRREWRIDEYIEHEPQRKKVVMTDKYSHVIRVRKSTKKPMKRKTRRKRTLTRGRKRHKKS